MSRSRGRRRSVPGRAARAGVLALAGGAGYLWWERRRGGAAWDPNARGYPEGDDRAVITADGAELAITVAGSDDAPTVVLPHCWMGGRAIWGPVAQRLVDSGLRVVLYDQRGHGSSTVGERAPSIPVLGDDLRAVLEAVGADDVVLAGHSMGGMTIQSYAAEHPVHFKERVRGIVLVSTLTRIAGRTPSPAAIERMMGERSSVLWRGPVGYALVRGSLGRAPRRADVELTLGSIVRTATLMRTGFLQAFTELDLRHVLPNIDVPTSVLVGARDTMTPPAAARVLADTIPQASLHILPHAGHMLPLERPDEVTDAIRSARLAGVA